jgi:hypothetical protein
MRRLSRVQHFALAGSLGAVVATAGVLAAAGSSATPSATSPGSASSTRASSNPTSTTGPAPTSAPSSAPTSATASSTTAQPTTKPTNTTEPTDPNDPVTGPGAAPGLPDLDITATPGQCTSQDRTQHRWSIRLTFANPKEAGDLEYLADALDIGINDGFDGTITVGTDGSTYRQWGPVHVKAGETRSIDITAGKDFFPRFINIEGTTATDRVTDVTTGSLYLKNAAAFHRIATICGSSNLTSTTSGTTVAPSSPAEHGSGPTEPPTPSPVTTRLSVTG